ncbi:MAG: hypothetical protein U9532_03815 ['Conium maculatum' witches'-broom phytoplasma]|nr:hypothetical protein ['Conium maculatum' witches'-broom phytoplasma]
MTKQNNNSLLKIFNIILATLLISHAFYFNEFSYETVFNFFEGHVSLLSMIYKKINPSCFMILFLSVTFLIGSLIMKTDFIKKA